jgi:hypothetical protein
MSGSDFFALAISLDIVEVTRLTFVWPLQFEPTGLQFGDKRVIRRSVDKKNLFIFVAIYSQ